MKNKGLTMTMVFNAGALNYGEGTGNTSMLKHVTLLDGNDYTRVSRQAILYDIRQQMTDGFLAPLGQDASDKSVIQYSSAATIDKYPEIDLFGYMKTEKGTNGQKRSAVARFSDAISLTPFNNDEDFLTNMGLAQRIIAETGEYHKNSMASREIDRTLYAYTVTVDLEKVGIDTNDNIEIPVAERAKRVNDLLDAINNQYRDIQGRREDLHPVFLVGGLYDIKRPYFMNAIKLNSGKPDAERFNSAVKSAGDNTFVGGEPGYLVELSRTLSTDAAFEKIKEEVNSYYGA